MAPKCLRGFMEAVDFPILMSNADVSAEPLLADKLAKSAVIERGGEKIGLIGLTTARHPRTVELAGVRTLSLPIPWLPYRARSIKLTAQKA